MQYFIKVKARDRAGNENESTARFWLGEPADVDPPEAPSDLHLTQ